MCDAQIKVELEQAGVTIVPMDLMRYEVPASIGGVLKTSFGTLTFRRAWAYWMVECRVPLRVARGLYVGSVGINDIRAEGHCGCLPPDELADGTGYITGYHIDTQEGLNLFVQYIQNEDELHAYRMRSTA